MQAETFYLVHDFPVRSQAAIWLEEFPALLANDRQITVSVHMNTEGMPVLQIPECVQENVNWFDNVITR